MENEHVIAYWQSLIDECVNHPRAVGYFCRMWARECFDARLWA